MYSLTLFFGIPAGVFLLVAGLFYINRQLPRLVALLPVLACYLAAAFILLMGGCHNVAHVALEGLEADLVGEDGKPREIIIGGEAEKGQPSGIEIPGYPVDALRLSYDQGGLSLHPGLGYHRGLLVRSGDQLVPLEPSGLPRLVSLESGDLLRVSPQEGGEVLAQWKLGGGKFDLNLDAKNVRWIGGSEKGITRVEGLPDQVLGLRAEGLDLIIKKGAGFKPDFGVMLNGRRLKLGNTAEFRTRFQRDVSTLSLVTTEPLAGTLRFHEAGYLRSKAWLDWESPNHERPIAYPVEMLTDHPYRVGGALEDDFLVKGLPPGVLEVVMSPEGRMTLSLTEAGKKAKAEGKLRGSYPQVNTEINNGVRIGPEGDPEGGIFLLLGGNAAGPAPMANAPDPDKEAEESESIDSSAPPTTPNAARWRCAWRPNAATHWVLPNREIVLPLINFSVSLGSRRPWSQQVFPLSSASPRESGLRSMLVYGPPHDTFRLNGAHLLQFEPGLTIERGESPLQPKSTPIGLLQTKQKLEFLQVIADEQGETHGVALGTPVHPAQIWDARRVAMRKRFPVFTVTTRTEGSGRHEKKIPVLKVQFEKPVIRSIPLGEVKADLKAREDGPTDLKVAINDRSGFSTLQHQVLFPGLSRWFDANADVQINWLSLDIQDDYRLQPKLKYGEIFKVGGDRRLVLRVTKHSVPWRDIAIVLVMGLVSSALCLLNGAGFAWVSLFFGAGFLTCIRVLFGRAALVNPPFNGDILGHAIIAVVLTPLIIGLGGYFIRTLLPGRLEMRLRSLEQGVGYGRLMLVAALGLGVRIVLLALGFKEALALGSTRIALSIAFVPFYVLLFALCFYVLWREKLANRTLGWTQIWRFVRCALVLSFCQTATAVLVSDLGMMLYFIPQALVMAAIGVVAGTESILKWLREDAADSKHRQNLVFALLSGLLPMIPLLLMTIVFAAPQWAMSAIPGLKSKIMTEEQIVADNTDLVTDSTLLRVLQFTNREYLINLGTDSAERIAQDHAIMENYCHRGLLGEGYLKVEVLPAKFVTAMNDNVSAIFIFAQFGVLGALAVLVAYVAISLATGAAQGNTHSFTSWLALIAGLSFSFVSVYMMAANYGLLPFTGRNMYLLGLNSLSDIVESLLLLVLIVLGVARAEFHEQQESVQNAANIGLGEIIGSAKST